MGFLKKLFGGGQKEYVDTNGIYFYIRCDHCGTIVKVRANKQSDLSREEGGFVWYKTIVDNRCFRRMQTVVHFDGRFRVTNAELTGGTYVAEAEYKTANSQQETKNG